MLLTQRNAYISSSLLLLAASTNTAIAAASVRSLQGTAVSDLNLTICQPAPSNFTIELRDMGSTPARAEYVEAFTLAAARWSKVIVGDVTPDFPAGTVSDWFDGFFDTSYNGAVDDLVIGFEVPTTIDGPGGVLGSAGSAFVRRDAFGRTGATISGIMIFDGADLDAMPIADVKAIVLHEMGHVLGLVGTTSSTCNAQCNPNRPFRDGVYSCQLAPAEYDRLVESFAPSSSLLLENSGGMGTACGHWEEDVFRTAQSSELMTGFFEANLFQPLSMVTVAGLDDLNAYEVDYCGADVWPATEDTIQKWEVFKTTQNMTMDGMMSLIPPGWALDENGVLVAADSLMDGGSSSSSGGVSVFACYAGAMILSFLLL